MKTTILSLTAALLSCLPASSLIAGEAPDCPDNSCFDTEIIREESAGNCTTYTLEISNNGDCRYALSHFSVEIPCGRITDVSNSEGWAMEVGTTDPTTGITGIKVDDIKKFGEGNEPQSFTLTYTVCNTGSCSKEELTPSRVAYKAATCVHYQDIAPPYTPMSAELNPTDASCAGNNDGAVDLILNGGKSPYTYRWNNGAGTEDIESLAAGAYSVTIIDAAGESLTLETTVGEADGISLTINSSNPGCAYDTDGSIDLSVTGGSGTYSYQWSSGQTTEDLANLGSGTYTVTVTDTNGCTATASTNLRNPQAIFIRPLTVIQPDCNGNAGSISVEALYGTAPYTYNWSTGETSSSLDNLSAGTYSVTVTDANGCENRRSFTINAPTSPQLNLSATNCGNTLSATVNGGTAPYTYQWSTGETSSSIEISEGGAYELTVTDANGCSATDTISAGDPAEAISLSIESQNVSCYGDADGSIDLTVEGGSGEYTYEWSTGETTEDLNNLRAGTYTVTVTDANGCSNTATVSISAPRAIFIRPLSLENVNCQGEGGSILVEAMFGTAPYTYEWSTGESGQSISELQQGYYMVTVTDANGCTASRRFSILEETAPTVSISSSGCGSSFELEAGVSGGTAPYTYVWNNGETTSGISAGPGNYSVTVTDANGCSSTAEISLQESESSLSLQYSSTDVRCTGGNDGTARIEVSGGTAPYSFDWTNGNTTAEATDLTAGLYSVQVTDATGCSNVIAFTIAEPTPISLTALVEANTHCEQANGSIEISISGGSAPYTFEWDNGANSQNLSGLSADNYTLTVTDANNCVAIRSFTVEDQTANNLPTASIENSEVSVCQGTAISIPLSFTGEGPYTFSYTDGTEEFTVSTTENPYMLDLSPEVNTTISLISVENSCGAGTATGAYTITVTDCDGQESGDCEDNCFSTEVISSINDGNCRTVTLQVNTDGDCAHALSHFNIAIGCGRASNVSNSGGWAMEVNAYDPTTGLYGIKIDDIKGFGENNIPESFTVTYTLCSQGECEETENSWNPLVAYKAATCVFYDQASGQEPTNPDDGEVVIVPDFVLYPNPINKGQMLNLKVTDLYQAGTATLTISNLTGTSIYQARHSVSPDQDTISLRIDQLPSGTYIVMLEMYGHVITKQLYVL